MMMMIKIIIIIIQQRLLATTKIRYKDTEGRVVGKQITAGLQ